MFNRLSISMLLFGLLATAGCSKASAPATVPNGDTANAGPTCDDAGAKLGVLARAAFDTMDDAQQAEVARLAAEACVADAWSAEAIACASAMTEGNDGECKDLLTEAQQESFHARLEPVIGGLVQDRGGDKKSRDEFDGDMSDDDDDFGSESAADPCEGGE